MEEEGDDFDQRSTEEIDRECKVKEKPPGTHTSDYREIQGDKDQVRDQPEDRLNDKDEVKVVLQEDDVNLNDQESRDKVSTYHHKSGDLHAEDFDQHMANLPEVSTPAANVTIDDIQVGDPGVPLTDDQKKL